MKNRYILLYICYSIYIYTWVYGQYSLSIKEGSNLVILIHPSATVMSFLSSRLRGSSTGLYRPVSCQSSGAFFADS